MSTEEEFMMEAIRFLQEIGVNTADVRPETHLFEQKVLDSLGTLAFLDFLEQQTGGEIDVEKLDIAAIATLRDAFKFVLENR